MSMYKQNVTAKQTTRDDDSENSQETKKIRFSFDDGGLLCKKSKSHTGILVHHNQTGRCLLHPPASQGQSEDVLNGVRHSQQKCFQSGPVLLADEAVEHRVQAAICMCQTHSQGESVGLSVVEGFTEGGKVKFDQHPPQGDGLVGQPADKKREDHDGDGAGDFGAAALASPLVL